MMFSYTSFRDLADYIKWSNLRSVLILKLTGNIPWLIIVPVLAVILEFVDDRLRLNAHLPYSIFLVFVIALSFAAAHLAYAVGCPPPIKGIRSLDEWHEKNARTRKGIMEKLEQDKKLTEQLTLQIGARIDQGLGSIPSKHAFTAEQITIIKFHLMNAVSGKTSLLGEAIELVADTSPRIFDQLNIARLPLRILCAFLILVSFILVFVQIVLRLISVFHATFG